MNQPLFSFYGDDFTGSTDVLEALAGNGVPTVLFPEPPDPRRLAAFPECRAIGVAGESRSRSPEWMSAKLPSVFESLKAYGAPICQYKVCSTFDSSPETGSIGRALEIGQAVFQTPCVPIAVAAPHLKRYVLFGNLFADSAGVVYRIDRHPAMSCHPVTPMKESDLRLHLARQTDRPIGLLDILAMRSPDPRLCLTDGGIVLDGVDDASLEVTGRLLSDCPFVIGSSGLTHALIRYWRTQGIVPPDFASPVVKSCDRLIVVSGSCSPVTESQIRWATANGFAGLRAEPSRETLIAGAVAILSAGTSVVLYTALGPQDCGGSLRGEPLGAYLGEVLLELLRRTGVRRVLLAGGDTSTHAVRQLGIDALTFAGFTTPGAPLCQCHSYLGTIDGLEIVLKGGQVGPPDYFDRVRRGNS